jgi:hypothetical protein
MGHALAAFLSAEGLGLFRVDTKGDVAAGRGHPPDDQVAIHVEHRLRQKPAVGGALEQRLGEVHRRPGRHRLPGADDGFAIDLLDVMHGGQRTALLAVVDQDRPAQMHGAGARGLYEKLGLVHGRYLHDQFPAER